MNPFQVGIVGFDVTPRFHPQYGAWGTTPKMTKLDLPLLSRCIAFEQDGRKLLWYGSDLIGETPAGTNVLRAEVAAALGLQPAQIVWSSSQTHSSGALPGSVLTGSSICDVTQNDPAFGQAERQRFMANYIAAGQEALQRLQPARVHAGRGFCDSISYNRRFPMPTGGIKFSRHHSEGLQSGKPFDTTIGLVRFDDLEGKPLGGIFNFCAHPATMINGDICSPDWVGSARQVIEAAVGAPFMYVQGFCGNVNCYHIFGTPEQARQTGQCLGKAAVEALPTLIPVRSTPFNFASKTIQLDCQPMPTRQQFEAHIAARKAFVDSLTDDPSAVWFCGINAPERFTAPEKILFVEEQMRHLREGLRMLAAGETSRTSLSFTLGALRIGDLAAVLSPGENFTETGMLIRNRSPFVHTLICGDTNGVFGYIPTDVELDRGGYEADSYWKMLYHDGFRTPPAKGTVGRIVETAVDLLQSLQKDS